MATRVLIINKQLAFAVTTKQALEQTGVFDVHPFTALDAALDYLQDHPQDVALVDFALPGINGVELVQRLRAVQPDLAIIASPRPADATSVMRSMRLQGMINTPFSVRDIVPLIEQGVEDMQGGFFGDVDQTTQSDALKPLRPMSTRLLDEASPDDQTEWQPPAEPGFGKTRILDEDIFKGLIDNTGVPDEEIEPPPSGEVFGQTRILDDELPDPPSSKEFGKTRILDDEPPAEPPFGETRIFDDAPDETSSVPGQTRMFGGEVPESGSQTPLYGRPGSVPEISNLESVLAGLVDSSLFEPVVTDEDTPAVSTKDSEALRQFIATSGQTGDAGFDDILEAIEPDQPDAPTKRDGDRFSNLVESMRSNEPPSTLPDRQQQFMDFILTSGMDNVLQEIEKVKTGTLRQMEVPPSEDDSSRTFQRLAQEEPPMPTLEESGTIGDLMIGVSDKSFRNVLAVLRGEEEVEESEISRPRTLSQQEMEEAFAAFYDPVQGVEPLPEVQPRPTKLPQARSDEFSFSEPPIEEEPGDSTLAQIILEAALDESTPQGSSLGEVMTNIENRLSVYRPDIQPLPSWGPAFERRKREEERLIREPDFLPEELPPPLEVSAELPELEHTDRFNIETTKPSSRQVIEAHPEDIDTDQYERSPMSAQVAEETPTSRPEWVEEESDEFTPLPADFPEETVESEITAFEVFGQQEFEVPAEQWPAVAEDAWLAEAEAGEVWEEAQPEEVEVWQEDVVQEEATPEEAVAEAWQEAVQEEAWPESVAHQEEMQPQEAWPDEAAVEAWPEEQVWAEQPDVTEEAWEDTPVSDDEGLVAQLALNLTQASLELTAEATLLTRDGEMVASAGHLAGEDIEELSSIIAHDWEAYPEGARIRFVTLVSSGKDYMLYSLKTDEGFTLSLIFAGTTPLRVIRRQGQRLAAALQAVPEAPADEAPPPVETGPEPEVVVEEKQPQPRVAVQKPVEVGVLTAYAFVWILRDRDLHLTESTTQAIHAGLSIQLAEQRWRIKNVQVAEDYIYLLADVPGDKPAQQLMRDLQHRSAEIAHAQDESLNPADLWADSYFILTPGRELDMDEIMGFINFERMT